MVFFLFALATNFGTMKRLVYNILIFMKDISPILKSLGLLDSEIKTYISALQHGPSTVIELTKLTKLSRQATYVAIETLTDRGLMTSVVRGKKRYYQAEHPKKLLDYAQRRKLDISEKVQDLERLIPDLELGIGGERPTVKLFEGKDGLYAMLSDYRASHPRHVVEYSDLDALFKVLSEEDLAPMKKELDRLGTQTVGIYHGTLRAVRPSTKTHRVEDQTQGYKTNISIADGKIALVTFEGKMYSMIIENQALADTMKYIFNLAIEALKRKSSS